MTVPLARIFAQQPLIASCRYIIKKKLEDGSQLEIIEALSSAQDSYKEQILKLVVNLAEQASIEVDPDVWEVYYSLKTPAALERLKNEAKELSLIRFDLPLGQKIHTLENRSILIQGGNTGHRTWESSLALTEYICSDYESFSSCKEIIELGAGTGVVSLAMAKLLNVKMIYATDGSSTVVEKLRDTVISNGVSDVVTPMLLDWYDLQTAEQLPKGCTVFAGDILYGITSSFGPILDLLDTLQPERVLICNAVRNLETYEVFKRLCADRKLFVRELRTFKAENADETDYMFLVSVPPVPIEILEIRHNRT